MCKDFYNWLNLRDFKGLWENCVRFDSIGYKKRGVLCQI